ncbi:MAG: tyrosine-type recombinase/integrase [Candidatus Obscuribacterales bacterium]|nr:tyrosine-type recombinase/integrase [Candidatus Obscuribacterales bacterium]
MEGDNNNDKAEWSVNISGLAPSAFSVEIKGNRRVITIFLSGNSTVSNCGDEETENVSPCRVTLRHVLESYLAHRLNLRPKTRRAYQKIAEQRLFDWYDLSLTAITKSMVEERHQFISTDGGKWKASHVQANMTMRVLKLLLNYAMVNYENEYGKPIISLNPVMALTVNKRWHRMRWRQGIIPDHKLPDWYAAVVSDPNAMVKDYLLFVLLTGLRRNEAASLTWDDIDFESKTLEVNSEKTKNHKTHRLPLSPFLLQLLQKRYHLRKSNYVFPGRSGPITQFSQVLNRIRKKSGCNFSIHDLRRSFLTMAEKLGIPHYALKKLANHSGGNDTTFGYLIVDVERLRTPMETITDSFLKLMRHG